MAAQDSRILRILNSAHFNILRFTTKALRHKGFQFQIAAFGLKMGLLFLAKPLPTTCRGRGAALGDDASRQLRIFDFGMLFQPTTDIVRDGYSAYCVQRTA